MADEMTMPGTRPVTAEVMASRAAGARRSASGYRRAVDWTFAVFNGTRLFTYLPTLWAICASGNSSQYSVFTWLAWVGANASMAAWLYENHGRKLNKAIVVSMGNSVMCLVTCVLITLYR